MKFTSTQKMKSFALDNYTHTYFVHIVNRIVVRADEFAVVDSE